MCNGGGEGCYVTWMLQYVGQQHRDSQGGKEGTECVPVCLW